MNKPILPAPRLPPPLPFHPFLPPFLPPPGKRFGLTAAHNLAVGDLLLVAPPLAVATGPAGEALYCELGLWVRVMLRANVLRNTAATGPTILPTCQLVQAPVSCRDMLLHRLNPMHMAECWQLVTVEPWKHTLTGFCCIAAGPQMTQDQILSPAQLSTSRVM